MSNDTLRKLFGDWRVLLLVVLVVGSIIAIGPHFEDGKFTTNLQYGLDLQEGSWLQMEFQAEVLTVQTDVPIDQLRRTSAGISTQKSSLSQPIRSRSEKNSLRMNSSRSSSKRAQKLSPTTPAYPRKPPRM